MVNETIMKFLEFDEAQKNTEWAAQTVRLVIRDALPIISKEEYDNGKDILFGKFPDANFNKIFTGATMKRYQKKLSSNSTVNFFERIRNSLIDERTGADLTITVNSLDPEKQEKKTADRELLRNRKGIEGLLNEITANNGMPPRKVQADSYHGNVDEFDKMGGDEFDPTDLDNFFDGYWGLKAELYLQNPINAIIRENQTKRDFDKYMNDIFICLHSWSQLYVDDIEGGIKREHLFPYEVNVLHATGSNDYKDAGGFNIRKSTNVRGFMRKFGTYFDFERDWGLILNAVNGGISHGYTGIIVNGQVLYGDWTGKVMDFQSFLDMPIAYNYTEWKTINKTTRQWEVTPDGNIISRFLSPEVPRVDGAATEDRYAEDTYYAYTLDFSSQAILPTVVKWGKLYIQDIEGQSDEYSGFSIIGNKRDGVPIVEVLKPLHQIIQVSFKMLEMLINDIKPDGLVMNYSSIVKVAENLKAAKDVPNDRRDAIDLFMQMVEESPNLLADTPTSDEGDTLGGGNLGVQPKKNGLNAAAQDIIKIIDWCEGKATVYLGTEGIELTQPDGGYKLSIENKKKTRQATAFIDFILLNHMEDICISILNKVQSISKVKDIPAYKYLKCQIGEACLGFIAGMKRAPHRYGIYLDTFNNDIQIMEIRQMAQQSLLNKEISLEQYMVLMSYENPKQAARFLAYERKKTEKKAQQNAMNALQQQDALAQKEHQRKMELENLKGQWLEKARSQEALGFSNAAQINAKAAIEREKMQQEGLDKRSTEKANNEIDKIAETATRNAQKPLL